MTQNTTVTHKLLKELAIITVSIPGYLLTFLPWLFFFALVAIAVSNGMTYGEVSLDLEGVPYNLILVSGSEVYVLFVAALGLWVFLARITKYFTEMVGGWFIDSFKGLQLFKAGVLTAGWILVVIVAAIVTKVDVSGFGMKAFGLIATGLASFGLEYVLSRFWHLKD